MQIHFFAYTLGNTDLLKGMYVVIDLIMRRRKTALKSYIQSTSNDDDGDDGYDGDHYNWDTEDGDDGDDEEDVRCKFDHLAFTTIHTWSVKEFHLLM